MENIVASELSRNIGVSNYDVALIIACLSDEYNRRIEVLLSSVKSHLFRVS
jgi:diketogulonate reductase-like aldo/keto reductase